MIKLQGDKLQVKILGSAQDGGLPHPLCQCINCQKASTDKTFKRFVSSIALFDSEKAYVFDATADLAEQLLLLKEHHLEGIFITHVHIGHILGLLFLGKEAASTHNLPVYCTQEVKDFLETNKPFRWLVKRKNIELKVLQSEKSITLGKVRITPFLVNHRNEDADTVGYLLEVNKKLVYIPDMDRLTKNVLRRIREADIAIIDGTFYSADELPQNSLAAVPHPLVENSMKLLKEIPTKIYFTHLNHTNPLNDPSSKAFKDILAQGFNVSYRGMTFRLGI
ncbi:MAG: pyrroloquinoline quinone biosynthesis protein PqqB [Candidatus Heimdallarchaeota archaeon]|nr:pyrroloquinoline quinone biosynthesis protein PqqB [Candidatus Heimdallarchaeota archaeon]